MQYYAHTCTENTCIYIYIYIYTRAYIHTYISTQTYPCTHRQHAHAHIRIQSVYTPIHAYARTHKVGAGSCADCTATPIPGIIDGPVEPLILS
jgi:hypothetical protein